MATLEILAWKQEDYDARRSRTGYEQRRSWVEHPVGRPPSSRSLIALERATRHALST